MDDKAGEGWAEVGRSLKYAFLATAVEHEDERPCLAILGSGHVAMAAVDLTRSQKELLILAARFNVTAKQLEDVANATIGLRIPRLTDQARAVIDSDKFRMIARMKRDPVQDVPAARKATEPGEVWVADASGPWPPSCVDGSVYELSMTDQGSDVELDAHVKLQTSEEWFSFVVHVQVVAAAAGRTIAKIRFDRGSQMRSEEFKRRVETELKILVELAPGGRHEGVGANEASNDVHTRAGEALCGRGQASDGYILPARRCARQLRQWRPKTPGGPSRWHVFSRRPYDLITKPLPLTFKCEVAILNDEKDRHGKKGGANAQRAADGVFLYMDGNAHVVRKFNGHVVARRNVEPLNEYKMVLEGLPNGLVTDEKDTNTEGLNLGKYPPLRPVEPAAPKEKPAPRPIVPDGVAPAGTELELWYLPEKRAKKKVYASATEHGEWFPGTVVTIRDVQVGSSIQRQHLIAWHGSWEGEMDYVDLADDGRVWRTVPEADEGVTGQSSGEGGEAVGTTGESSEEGGEAAGATDPNSGDGGEAARATNGRTAKHQKKGTSKLRRSTRTRASSKISDEQKWRAETATAYALHAFTDGGLGPEHKAAYAEQVFGENEENVFEPDTFCSFTSAMMMRISEGCYEERAQLFAAKAEHGAVDIKTAAGDTIRLTPPANLKQRDNAPDGVEWAESDRKAVDVIAAAPGNYWMALDDAKDAGYVITPAGVTRKYKQDLASGQLESRNGRKSRVYFANPVFEGQCEKRGEVDERPYSSGSADQLLCNTFLSDACERRRGMAKADVGNAYLLGTRTAGRTITVLRLPEGLKRYDDQGRELVLVLVAPLWGERAAGFEWSVKLRSWLAEAGWMEVATVPCLYYKTLACGHEARMITIVDDLLFSEADMRYDIAESTVAFLREKAQGTVTYEREPKVFAGRVLERTFSDDGDTLKMSMAKRIEDAVALHIPELLGKGKPPWLLEGKELMAALDNLEMVAPGERPAKATSESKEFQSIVGKNKWFQQVTPRLTLANHRCSCVVACPPEKALAAAKNVLRMAFEDRDIGITFRSKQPATESVLQGTISAHIDLDDTPPSGTLVTGDCTWNLETNGPFKTRDLYAIALTRTGAMIYGQTHNMGVVVNSSYVGESITVAKAGEITERVREIEIGMGVPPQGPTLVLTDNKATALVGSGTGSARARHCLRRYATFLQRVESNEVYLRHLPDPENPTDFMTKFTTAKKALRSARWLAGAKA